MKHLSSILTLAALVVLLSSCNQIGGLLAASSASNEVLVVMDDALWEAPTGRALYDVLNSPAKGLPQREPNFKILQVSPENFTSTFKTARNIIIPDISNIYSAGKIASEIDKYALGQVIMTIHAPDTTTFATFVTDNKDGIVDYIVNKEMERGGKWLKKESDGPRTRLQEVFGINMYFPKGLNNVQEFPDFYWATNNANRGRQDIVVYQIPYTTPDIFTRDSLIALRDSVLGKYITGSFDSRMKTTMPATINEFTRKEIDGKFRAELRGLWEMEGDMMGGPYVMHAFVNENTGKVIVAETFVYAPEMNKRNLMRNLESTLYSIEIPEPEDAIVENK